MLNAETYARVWEIVDEVAQQPNASREACLAKLCDGDETLLSLVRNFLHVASAGS